MKRSFLLLILIYVAPCGFSQSTFEEMSLSEREVYKEHLYLGQPDSSKVYIRNGYVMKYDSGYRIPEWVAYHIIPDYLNTPKREKKYKYFRTDPDIQNAVKDPDYTGTGYARGHLAPYFAMGGDRDKNGRYSDLFDETMDPYDDKTVLQANYMSNIAPQDQNALNGAGGPWYALETKIRKNLIPELKNLHLVVGGIVSDPDNHATLINKKGDTGIAIPDKFYQVIIYHNKLLDQHVTAAFLFPHVQERVDLPYEDLIDYIVPVDSIELLTGLDFFPKLENLEESKVESVDNKSYWMKKFK